jgi:hypothetical protein
MAALEDLSGRTFGRLTVLGEDGGGWRCRCTCGRSVVVARYGLIGYPYIRSCGCLKRDAMNGVRAGKYTEITARDIDDFLDG